MACTSRLQQVVFAALIILASIFWAYRGVLANGFVSYDDIKYLFENEYIQSGLSLSGIRWALTGTYDANWFPVTWLSHMADISLFGLDPRGHHLVNLLLHTANSILLLWILFRSTGHIVRSAVVALIFALHPLHVESVAWVAERKDVLSTFFFMLTIAAYQSYTSKPTTIRYLTSVLFYITGLASKPMLVSLPLVLLLLDAWPLDRLARSSSGRPQIIAAPNLHLLREKIPFIILSAASCAVTYVVQSNGASVNSTVISPVSENVAHSIVNYVHYLYKIFWPVELAVLYPYVQELPSWKVIGASALLILITVCSALQRIARPYLLTGWLWFLFTLAPVIGFISIGAHSIADRYTYIPLTGISIMAVWGVADCLQRYTRRITVALLIAAVVLVTLGAISRVQVGYWKDSVTLFEHTLSVTSNNWVIHNNLAAVLLERNQKQQALAHLLETVRIVPEHANAFYNLGILYSSIGETTRAAQAFQRTIELNPSLSDAYFHLGIHQFSAGDRKAAYETYRSLDRIDPEKGRALGNYFEFLKSRPQVQ